MDHSPAQPASAVPEPNDGYASNPVISSAVRALRTFGGDDLSHGEAARLLALWTHVGELTAREKVAVLARFPRADVAEVGYRLATGGGEYADPDSEQPQGTEPGA